MSRQQTTILWLGLILIGLNIVVHIGDVKSVIFGGGSGTTSPKAITNAGSPGVGIQPGQIANAANPFGNTPPPPTTTPRNVAVLCKQAGI